ncbi:MAG: NfeD family protein, partial [Bacteroidota bacterium]
LIVFAVSVSRMLPKSERFSRLILSEELSAATGFISAETAPNLDGARGTALTALRPAGTADIDGDRVDVVTQGQFVDAGDAIEVVSARGAVVVVRPVPGSPEAS